MISMGGASTSSLVAGAAVVVELTEAKSEQRTVQATAKRVRTDKLVTKRTVLLIRLAVVQFIVLAAELIA